MQQQINHVASGDILLNTYFLTCTHLKQQEVTKVDKT
jgi:hypothetical protein